MQPLIQDLRYGVRMLFKNPLVTLIAILALTLGIGANTAIFSVVNAVLLRPLPYQESDRLVFLSERGTQVEDMSISYPNFTDWREQNRVFEHFGVFNRNSYNLTGRGEAERINAGQVSAEVFTALGTQPALGRVFTSAEDVPGGPSVVILSHGLWLRRFGGDPKILNQQINLNGRNYEVIGVMPNGYAFPTRTEMWVSAGQLSGDPAWKMRGNHPGLYGLARLKPGITIEQARADLGNIVANLAKLYPDSNEGNGVTISSLLENYVGDIRPALWFMLAAVSFVLLIACANIANLLLARATVRQKEMAVRAALGASRWRLIRQLLTESVILALIGGVLGFVIAQWGIDLILAISPNNIPRAKEIGMDWRVLMFTIAVSVITGILFGLIPALQSSETNVHETLKESGRGNTGKKHWVRSGLVIFEVATTLMLLICAGLMMRSFYRLQQVNPGFNYDHLMSMSISLPEKKYATPEQQINFFEQVAQNIRNQPGVKSVGYASGLPLGNNGWQTSFTVEGLPIPPPSQTPSMEMCLASPDYFQTMGIKLIAGRWFNHHDNRAHLKGVDLSKLTVEQRYGAALKVMIIDEEFARRHWPNENAIGKRIRLGSGSDDPLLEVVGVVGRVKMDGLNTDSNRVQGYLPYLQGQGANMTMIVKSAVDPMQMIALARAQVTAVDPEQPVFDVRTMEEIKSLSISTERLNLALLGMFAGVALILAIVGIYGVMNYAVTQRTHEIGIRMALGAQAGDVMKLVIGDGMKLVLLGAALGIGAALLITRFMQTLLFEVTTTDPLTYTLIALLLTVVALLACYIPARRAMKTDPMIALRYE